MIANINSIKPFDALKTERITVQFQQPSSSTPPLYYKAKIFNLDSQSVVYSSNQVAYGSSASYSTYVITKTIINQLRNGSNYKLIIQGSDKDGNEYDTITKTTSGSVFTCYKTPDINFTNLSNGQIIDDKYTFKFTYSQENGHRLLSGKFNLYAFTDLNNPLSSFDLSSTPLDKHNEAKYEVEVPGIKEDRLYYVEVIGQVTSAGSGYMEFTSGYYQFKPINTKTYGQFNFMTAINNKIVGGIRLSTDIKSANGKLYDKDGNQIIIEGIDGKPTDLQKNYAWIFPDGNKGLAITNGNVLKFDEGWVLNSDFSIFLIVTKMQTNDKIMTLKLQNNKQKYTDEIFSDVVGTLYFRTGRNRTLYQEGFFEQKVSNNYTYPITNKNEEAEKYTFNRVYQSNSLGMSTYKSIRSLQRSWQWYKNEGATWSGLGNGSMLENLFGVLIVRSGNYWSVSARNLSSFTATEV